MGRLRYLDLYVSAAAQVPGPAGWRTLTAPMDRWDTAERATALAKVLAWAQRHPEEAQVHPHHATWVAEQTAKVPSHVAFEVALASRSAPLVQHYPWPAEDHTDLAKRAMGEGPDFSPGRWDPFARAVLAFDVPGLLPFFLYDPWSEHQAAPVPLVRHLDAVLAGADRERFMAVWLNQLAELSPPSATAVLIQAYQQRPAWVSSWIPDGVEQTGCCFPAALLAAYGDGRAPWPADLIAHLQQHPEHAHADWVERMLIELRETVPEGEEQRIEPRTHRVGLALGQVDWSADWDRVWHHPDLPSYPAGRRAHALAQQPAAPARRSRQRS